MVLTKKIFIAFSAVFFLPFSSFVLSGCEFGSLNNGEGTNIEETGQAVLDNLARENAGQANQNSNLGEEYPLLLGDSNAPAKKDGDKDGVPDEQDKCPNSTPDGSGTVNANPVSPYYGCTCSQIQAMGGFQQQATCPSNAFCKGPYLVTYTQQPGSCSNGNVIPSQCAENSFFDQGCNTAYQQELQNQAAQKAQEDAQKQQMMQQGMEALKSMLGGGGDSGQQQPKEQGQSNESEKCKCPGGKPPIRKQDECKCCDPQKGCSGTATNPDCCKQQ